ncbi:MAG TPA: nascent polypeptide-associated complex protein [Candidatus Acidoferrales bacterium]|nr:nascent polypeptide-associated complex protein [Candidatus Acidoferrales bacterium]
MAYKALKAARGMPGGRDAMRMMQKMGMKVDEIANVAQVIIRTDSKDIVIAAPTVTLVTVQGQAMYQIAGGQVSESTPQAATTTPAAPVAIQEEDVKLVAQQTGKSVEEARKALLDAGGDLAKAIIVLKGQTSS